VTSNVKQKKLSRFIQFSYLSFCHEEIQSDEQASLYHGERTEQQGKHEQKQYKSCPYFSFSSLHSPPSPVPIYGFITSCPQDFSGQGKRKCSVTQSITPRMPERLSKQQACESNSQGQVKKKEENQQGKMRGGWNSPNAES
jgi:hypothetical protein